MLFWPESQVRSRSAGKARAKPVNDLSSGFRTGQGRTGQDRTATFGTGANSLLSILVDYFHNIYIRSI